MAVDVADAHRLGLPMLQFPGHVVVCRTCAPVEQRSPDAVECVWGGCASTGPLFNATSVDLTPPPPGSPQQSLNTQMKRATMACAYHPNHASG